MTVRRNPELARDLLDLIKKESGIEKVPFSGEENMPRKPKDYGREHPKSKPKKKVENYSCSDLLFYFINKSKDSGSTYRCSSKARELGAFKIAKSRYSNEEIILMIDFIFDSEQNYIELNRASPGILQTNWTNSLLPDALLWRDNKYSPRTAKNKVTYGEWIGDKSKDSAVIGDWGV